jgi:hypothetical protein
MKARATLLSAALIVCASGTLAEQRPEHYKGKEAATLDSAYENLADTNARIAELVADGNMKPEEQAELHRLTYTAENALAKVTKELEDLKELLEIIHLASEEYDDSTVLQKTPLYLEKSGDLFGK